MVQGPMSLPLGVTGLNVSTVLNGLQDVGPCKLNGSSQALSTSAERRNGGGQSAPCTVHIP